MDADTDHGADAHEPGTTYGDALASTRAINVNTTLSYNLNDCCEDAVRRLMATLMQLTIPERTLLFDRLRGVTLEQYGRRHRASKQTVHHWVQALREKHPILRGVI